MIFYNSLNETYNSTLTTIFPYLQLGFTTRKVGDCRKISTIQDYFRQSNLSEKKIVLLEQIHSSNVNLTNPLLSLNIEQIEECDGVVSVEKNVILVVRTADCVPVILFSSQMNCIGIAHIGWRGTLKHLINKMIHKMGEVGAKKNSLYLVIGPAINQCCYEIDIDIYSEFMSTMERFNNIAFKPHGDKFRVNLTRINYELALESGIRKNHIDYFPFCTSCNSDHFYSFRRDFKNNPNLFGEMMGYVAIKNK